MTDNNKNKDLLDDQHVTDHDYDGIRELNNPSPYWVLLLFLATVAFSLFYVVRYFGYPNNGKDQISEYNQTVAEAKLASGLIDPGQAGGLVLTDKEMLAQGAKLYTEKGCIACHGTKGEGNAIGPNLTDKFWIHGCNPAEVVLVISEGVLAKGMIPFKTTMNESQINSVATYILGVLIGSNPPNAKAPQGVECK